jgi:acetyl-CoA acetyltransferase
MRGGRKVVIAGTGLTRFVKHEEGKDYWDYGSEAILKALESSDMQWREIQAAFCGSVYTDTGSGHRTLGEIGMQGIPIVNVENACSSGASAFRLAYQSVATEIYEIVLVCGFDRVPKQGFLPSNFWPEWERYMGFNVQPANYALKAVRYMEEAGATEKDFARVTVKNRRNGVLNPFALFQKEVSIEEVLNSRLVAAPLRLLNCCPLAQGGAAVILCSKNKLKSKNKVITVVASVLTSGTYGAYTISGDSVKIHNPNLVEVATQQAWEMSGDGPEDIDVVQAYDTTSPSELFTLELLGFCKKGEAVHMLREGVFDLGGKLPVNTDGGLLSRGHPLGATGLAQIIEIVSQLQQDAGKRQVAGARVGLAHSMGAGPNSSITILRRER